MIHRTKWKRQTAVGLELLAEAGINATLALILNAIILLAALSYFGAVLTLPGIAGFILTIGMAVDRHVTDNAVEWIDWEDRK